MINTIFELMKELFHLAIFLTILGFITRLFLAHTLLGKIVAVTVKNIYLTLRGCIRIIKYLGKKIYIAGKLTNDYLVKKINNKNVEGNKDNKKSTRQIKVVNGNNNNLVDFQSAKQLRHKWNR